MRLVADVAVAKSVRKTGDVVVPGSCFGDNRGGHVSGAGFRWIEFVPGISDVIQTKETSGPRNSIVSG